MRYQRYLARVLLLAAFILGTVAAFTYKIDPGNIFGNNRLIEDCGTWLLKGYTIAITQNFDERRMQKYLLEHDEKNYDVIVLGSSRSMGIGQELIPVASMRNLSVSGASVEDDIALYFLYERLRGKPQKIIIGVDAWLLNKNNGQKRWKSLAQEYDYGKEKLGLQKKHTSRFSLDKYEQLISWPYFWEAFKRARDSASGSGYCLVEDKGRVASNADIIAPDGSHFPSAISEANNAEVEARKYISGSIYSLEGYDHLDENLQIELKTFFRYLKTQGTEIVLYLTPYHPLVYSHIAQIQKYQRVLDAEQFFRVIASEYNLSIIGSYDSSKCGLSNKDFTDGMHMRRNAMENLLNGKL